MVNWLENVADRIALDELPEPYNAIARKMGVKAALVLNENFGGLAFYFPKLDKILVKKRDVLIREEFNGTNYSILAVKYGLTERWVREIVDHKKPAKTGVSEPNQMEKKGGLNLP